MLETLISQPDCRAVSAQLSRSATNSGLYWTLSDVIHLADISAEVKCSIASGYRLIRVGQRVCMNDAGFEIALLNDVDASVAYYNRVETAAIPESNPRPAALCFVWRSPDARHAAVVREVAQSVFFNYIVERYDVILSDNHEVGEGRFFWQRQASTAIAYGLCVSYIRLTERLQPITTQEALNDLIDELWDEPEELDNHLMLVSKHERSIDSLSLASQREG